MSEANKISPALLGALPKADLHVHLDGSVRPTTLIELAQEYGVELPSYTEGGLRETVFKERYANLSEYLQGFSYMVGVLQSEVALERVAFELAEDCQAEGIRYLEVRFAPQLHAHEHLNTVQVLRAVNRGLERAQSLYNRSPGIQAGTEPNFEYGIICCAMRMFTADFSEYFATLLRAHHYAPAKEVYSMASVELARAAIAARDNYGLPIVGFDLAGEEVGYPADDHLAAFKLCQKNFMKKTVHAGEAYGPESIYQAITDLGADRIGHGTYLLDPGAIQDTSIDDRERYVERLGEYVSDRRITLEVCLTSNLQTNPKMESLEQHPLRRFRQARISTTLNTDNRTVSNTTLTRELTLGVEHLSLNRRDLKSMIIYAFKRSFFAGSYLSKRQYVRQVIDYYDRIERQHSTPEDESSSPESVKT